MSTKQTPQIDERWYMVVTLVTCPYCKCEHTTKVAAQTFDDDLYIEYACHDCHRQFVVILEGGTEK